MNKYCRLLLVVVAMLPVTVAAQERFFFLEPDTVPDCKMITQGTFINSDHPASAYRMVVANGIQTEYVQDGKYYVRSKMEFLSPCTYRSTVIEVTIPGYSVQPGAVVVTEILETQCQYIKLNAKMGKNEVITVFEKQE